MYCFGGWRGQTQLTTLHKFLFNGNNNILSGLHIYMYHVGSSKQPQYVLYIINLFESGHYEIQSHYMTSQS